MYFVFGVSGSQVGDFGFSGKVFSGLSLGAIESLEDLN